MLTWQRKKGLPYAFASHFASTHLHNALRIYKEEFKSSESLEQPYTMAGVNVFVADTDEQAKRLFTTVIRMFVGVLTGAKDALQPPSEMTEELKEMYNHPSVYQMLKYSFVGSKETVKKQAKAFLKETKVNEIIAVSTMYSIEDRIRSTELFGKIMTEINQQEYALSS